MGYNSDEIQYALDRRGFVEIPPGSTIERPIQLAHLQGQVYVNCPGDITYEGQPGRWAFEWNWQSSYSHSPARIIFRNIEYDRNSIDQGGFLRIHPGEKAPRSLSMKQCLLNSQQAYAIDARNVAYIDSIHMRDIRTNGGSAIRWISESRNGSGWVKLNNWRHQGGNRLGASFYFENMRNILRKRIIDEGSENLYEGLLDVYYGPIAFSDVNCSGYNLIDDLWSEPWGSWEDTAPECWIGDIRCDETSGNFEMCQTDLVNVSINSGGIEAGIDAIRVLGGHTSSNASSLRVDLINFFKLISTEKVKFCGKVYPVALSSMTNETFSQDDRDYFDDLNANSFRRPWRSAVTYLPYNLDADKITYVGSDNEANYTAEPAQYDA